MFHSHSCRKMEEGGGIFQKICIKACVLHALTIFEFSNFSNITNMIHHMTLVKINFKNPWLVNALVSLVTMSFFNPAQTICLHVWQQALLYVLQ
jgi:hypothetical protein